MNYLTSWIQFCSTFIVIFIYFQFQIVINLAKNLVFIYFSSPTFVICETFRPIDIYVRNNFPMHLNGAFIFFVDYFIVFVFSIQWSIILGLNRVIILRIQKDVALHSFYRDSGVILLELRRCHGPQWSLNIVIRDITGVLIILSTFIWVLWF